MEEGFGRRLAGNYRVVRDVYEHDNDDWKYGIQNDGYKDHYGWFDPKAATVTSLFLNNLDITNQGTRSLGI